MNNNYYSHETAIVSEDAIIGENTKIWVNCQIRENVTIGANCIISKDTYIDHAVKIGNNVKIQNGVSVFNGVTLEDDVFVGPNVVFTNDMYPRSFNEEWEVTNTHIGRGAAIGANATIRCGISLGEFSMVGAGSVVTKDVPDYTLVMGNPARKVSMVCMCGQPLKGIKCQKCGFETGDKK